MGMTDLKERMQRTAAAFGGPTFDLAEVTRVAAHEERRRRVSAGITAVVLVVLSGSLVLRAFDGDRTAALEGVPGVENGQIAYGVGRIGGSGEFAEVAVIDPASGRTSGKVAGGHSYYGDTWSPDGSRLAFWRVNEDGEPGDMDIWTMRADGTDLRQLTEGPGGDYNPTWSPDGTQILFHRNLGRPEQGEPGHSRNPTPSLMVMNADGSDAHPIAGGDADLAVFTAEWSPDGSTILTVSDDHAQRDGNPLTLAVIDPDGSNRRVLVEGFLNEAQWSADGSEIYFASEGALQAVRIADGEPNVVIQGLDTQGLSNVRISPDGATVLFTKPIEEDRSEELWIARTDGSEPSLVADGLEWREPAPAWAPDGTAIAFVRGGDIWTIDLRTGDQSPLTSSPEFETMPTWGSAG
jgi:Tol biopolymer transport system component